MVIVGSTWIDDLTDLCGLQHASAEEETWNSERWDSKYKKRDLKTPLIKALEAIDQNSLSNRKEISKCPKSSPWLMKRPHCDVCGREKRKRK